MKFKHIFFDLDNTLWDHRGNAYLAIKELYEEAQIEKKYNLIFDDFHRKYYDINEHLWELLRDGKISKQQLRDRRFYDTLLHFGVDDQKLAQYFDDKFMLQLTVNNLLVEGTLELLEYLTHKGYHLHIVSNGFAEVTNKKIENSKIEKYFKTITCADDVGVRKPDAKVFQHALDLAKAQKEESIFIGDDWVADVQGALDFGMDVIFFDSLKEGNTLPNLKVVTALIDIKQWL